MKKPALSFLATTLALALAPGNARADVVQVTATGTVEYNQIGAPPLGNVQALDRASMTFEVDTANFVNGASFPVRGYVIDPSSFTFTLGSTVMTLQSPFPGGQTPYFSIRNDDPAVDGFLLTTAVEFPVGVPINQTGVFGQFIDNFYVTYGGATLPSLDILDALGSYDFTGLSVFNWTVDDGPFNPLGIIFEQLTISLPSTSFCDASDGSLSSCPCSNPGNPDTGCDNAQATGGVRLDVTSQDTTTNLATLTGTNFPPAGAPSVLVIRGNNKEVTPAVFFDGIRCVGVTGFARMAATNAFMGTSTHALDHGAGPGTYYYQLWYRNIPSSFCDSNSAANASNGQTIVW